MIALSLLQHLRAIGSAASDRNHDFQPVAVRQRRLGEPAARHDFAITLHRHALAREFELFEQGGNIGVGLETPGGAVNADFYHWRNLYERPDSVAMRLQWLR
jgi:hypothetical protein